MAKWSKEAIAEFLRKEQLHYQKIDLPFGLTTPGADRQKTCEMIFGGPSGSGFLFLTIMFPA